MAVEIAAACGCSRPALALDDDEGEVRCLRCGHRARGVPAPTPSGPSDGELRAVYGARVEELRHGDTDESVMDRPPAIFADPGTRDVIESLAQREVKLLERQEATRPLQRWNGVK